MADVDSAPRREDALDDLFAYDASMDDVFNIPTTPTDNGASEGAAHRTDLSNRAGLGIDEEVVVTKKRAPVAKLDATR